MSFLSRAIISTVSSLRVILTSRATWSFLDLAVCRRLPVSPSLFVSSASTNIWISSAFGSNGSLPLSISASISLRPLTIVSLSPLSMIPHSPSIVACAIEPVMSCLYILASNLIDELKSLTLSSTSFVNLPAHIFCDIALTAFAEIEFYLLLFVFDRKP